MRPPSSTVRVMQSFRAGPQTNPYLLDLLHHLEPYVNVVEFSRLDAVFGRYDVLHLHWPEVLLRGSTWPRTAARFMVYLTILLTAMIRRRAIVRTIHNPQPHEPLGVVGTALLRLTDCLTTRYIALNEWVSVPECSRVIPHSHYREHYSVSPSIEPIAGRALFFGHMRRYKGVTDLVELLPDVDCEPFELRLVGNPHDAQLIDDLMPIIESNDRISGRFEFVADHDLATEIASAELVVLPYRSWANSGALLAALSVGRPVLVPDNDITAALQDEVGPAWVRTYEPPLLASTLCDELAHARAVTGEPDLSRRDWSAIAASHVEVYTEAIATATACRRSRLGAMCRRGGRTDMTQRLGGEAA